MSKKRNNIRGKRLVQKKKVPHLDRKIIAFLHDNPEPHTPKEIFNALKLKTKDLKHQVVQILRNFLAEEIIQEVGHGSYALKNSKQTLIGNIQINPSGSGYFLMEEDDDIFVSRKNTAHALNNDLVELLLIPNKRGKKQEGQVLRIIERNKASYIGVVQKQGKNAFIQTKNVGKDFFVPQKKLQDAKDGDRVEVVMTSWPSDAKNPFGKVLKNFGQVGSIESEVQGTLAEFGLPYEFPPEVEKEAKRFSDQLTKEDLAERRDFRGTPTFTIDPVDAKDFDDALSVKRIGEDLWEIGVHIADVSYYLDQSEILDKEAQSRATSIYLVDRVVPMLPEVLSNGLCSLRPHEVKRTYSVVFHINERATIKDVWIGRTIIESNHRFTYEEAQEIIETQQGPYGEEILLLDNLAKKFRKKRTSSGAIAFDKEEIRFRLDDEKNPIGVYFKISKDANKLIEEFMLLANKKVGESIGKVSSKRQVRTFVYRIHDQPDIEKLEKFKSFVTQMGFEFNLDNPNLNEEINRVLAEAYETPFGEMVELLAMRSMSKAKYSTNNIGHYGLGFKHYSHFTSPIRRYPDVMAHRLLTHYAKGGDNANPVMYEGLCKHSSDMEKLATDAERSSIKFMQVKLMSEHVGESFEATVSGITERGIYAEIIDNHCEGMIRISSIESDFYMAFPKQYMIKGVNTGRVIKFGDKIKVKITHTDLTKKHIDMVLVE